MSISAPYDKLKSLAKSDSLPKPGITFERDEPLKKIFQFLYGPIIDVIYFFMRNYKTNRARLNKFLDNKKISSILQFIAVAILITWLLVFTFSTEEDRRALTERIKQSLTELKAVDTK